MTMHLLGQIVKRLAFVPFLLTLASPVWAQEEMPTGGGFAKDGMFVGASTLLNERKPKKGVSAEAVTTGSRVRMMLSDRLSQQSPQLRRLPYPR